MRRPDDEIVNRPTLKVRTRDGDESGDEAEPARPTVRLGTLVSGPPDADAPKRGPIANIAGAQTVVVPPAAEGEQRFAYATHRPPPPDEKAERRQLAALTGRKQDREVSTGFVLGIALIVVVLLGGILIARLSNRVQVLEQKIVRLEGGVRTAELPR